GRVPRPLQVGRHRLGLPEDLVERDLTLLDGEEAGPKVTRDLERGRALAQPSRRRREEADKVVGVLRPELAWQVEVGRLLLREPHERRELVRFEQSLVGK